MKENLKNGVEYSRQEIQAWLETRSRICSTPLWQRALEGKAAFEIGHQTFKLTPVHSERYLITCIETSILIASKKKRSKTKHFKRLLALFTLLVIILSAVMFL